MLRWILLISSVISAFVLSLILNLTSPGSIGPFGILFVFVLIYSSSLGVVTFLIFGLSKITSFISKAFAFKKPLKSLSFKRSYYFAGILASGPVIVIGLESVGAAGFGGVLLLGVFLTIGCLYVSKRID